MDFPAVCVQEIPLLEAGISSNVGAPGASLPANSGEAGEAKNGETNAVVVRLRSSVRRVIDSSGASFRFFIWHCGVRNKGILTIV